jgi:hypothetical protein
LMLMRRLLFCFCMLIFSHDALSAEHAIGLSVDSAMLAGDLDTMSDTGYSGTLTYELKFNPVIGIGLRTGYEYAEGEAWVVDTASKYKGVHEYTVSMAPIGMFARIRPQFGLPFIPYIEGEAGALAWIPEHAGPEDRLPTDLAYNWGVSPFAGIGGGVEIPIGSRWSLDLNASARYVFEDKLDSIDGEYLTGSATDDDILYRGGIALVFRFGGSPAAPPPPPVPAAPPRSEPKPPLDSDGDGIPDYRDKAPQAAEDKDGFMDSDGVPDPDNDADGVPDVIDGAPNDSEDHDGFQDADGVPDLDNDGDGILDTDDPHPNVAEQAVVPEPSEYFTIHVASFRSDSDALSHAAQFKGGVSEGWIRQENIPESGTWNRVYVGRYETEAAARAAAIVLLQDGVPYARIFRISATGEAVPGVPIGFFIHVGSLKNQDYAVEYAREFEQGGYPVAIRSVDLGEQGIWNRVLVGPYDTQEAKEVAQRILDSGLSDYTALIR